MARSRRYSKRYRIKSKRIKKRKQKSVTKRGKNRITRRTRKLRGGSALTTTIKTRKKKGPPGLNLPKEPTLTTEGHRQIVTLTPELISTLAKQYKLQALYVETTPIKYTGLRTFEVEFPTDKTNCPKHIKTLFPNPEGYTFEKTEFNTVQTSFEYSGCLITKDGKKSLLKIIRLNGDRNEGRIINPEHIENLFKTFQLQQTLSVEGVCPKIEKFTIIQGAESFSIYIVFEYLEGYINYSDFKNQHSSKVTNEFIDQIINQIKSKIEIINKKGFNHNDLNSGNIMINTEKNDVKIIDFDKARECNGDNCNESSDFTKEVNPFDSLLFKN